MKTKTIENHFSLATIKGLNTRQKSLVDERKRLKDKSQAIRCEKQKASSEFIAAAMLAFVGAMQNPLNQKLYIRGQYTDEFTFHVSRNIDNWLGLSKEHARAIEEYNRAFENLNVAFLSAVMNDEKAQQKIIRNATLKNLNKAY